MRSVIQIAPELELKRQPSLRADFAWTLSGNTVYAGGQFATLILLAKLVRPEMVGQYALGLALVYPIMQFTNLQLRAVMNTDITQETKFGYYLGLRLFTSTAALLAIFAAACLLGYDRQLTTVVLMVGLAYGVETISDVYYARLQLNGRMPAIAKSMMARALLSTLALVLVAYATRSILWAVASVACARVIVLIGYDRNPDLHGSQESSSKTCDLLPRFNLRVQGKLLCASFPLGIVLLLANLNSSIPSFFIKHELGERDVAIFAVIGFVVSVGNMAVVSLGQSAFTRLARAYASGDTVAFASLLGRLLASGVAIGVCGLILSKWVGQKILAALFRPEYVQRAELLPWITAAGVVLFMAQVLGFAMTAANLYRPQVALNLFANLALFVACYWLVERQGLIGAIYAMFLGASVQFLGSVVALAAALRKRTQITTSEVEAV